MINFTFIGLLLEDFDMVSEEFFCYFFLYIGERFLVLFNGMCKKNYVACSYSFRIYLRGRIE